MKKTFGVALAALIGVAMLPQQSLALSCLDPEGMIAHYIENSEYMVVQAKATKQTEFVKNEADTTDPNMMYPEGYSAQLLEVSESFRGGAPATPWVYFERNGTWNYLCVGEPPKVGTESIYVLHKESGLFSFTSVAGVYAVDSEIADKLLAALADEDNPFDETMVYESPKSYWLEELKTELLKMAFIVKVKLAEWKFWAGL